MVEWRGGGGGGGGVKAGYCVQGLVKVGIFGSHLPFQTSGAGARWKQFLPVIRQG